MRARGSRRAALVLALTLPGLGLPRLASAQNPPAIAADSTDVRTLWFDGDSLVLLPRAFAFGPGALIVLMVTFLATTIIASLALAPFRADLDATQQKSRVLAWQLRQFVPRSKSDDSP